MGGWGGRRISSCLQARPHAEPLEGEAVWVELLGAPVIHGVDLGVIVRVQRVEEGGGFLLWVGLSREALGKCFQQNTLPLREPA